MDFVLSPGLLLFVGLCVVLGAFPGGESDFGSPTEVASLVRFTWGVRLQYSGKHGDGEAFLEVIDAPGAPGIFDRDRAE